jgi:signal transduction histidine kinase
VTRAALAILAAALAFQAALFLVVLVERRARRRAEARARENLSQVAHLSRVAAIGELAGSFAHEINTPLAAVLNNAEAARRWMAKAEDGPASRQVQACLQDIAADVRRAADVMLRMRSILRREEARQDRLDLAAVIRNAVRLVQTQADDRDVTLSSEVSADLPFVRGDQVQLVQVLLNLLMNAIDALANVPRGAREISVLASRADHGIEVQVADTGPGIPPSQVSQIFEPFYTTKPSGLGLGLTISKSIIEAHGGSLGVSSGPGGSVFSVRLPRPGRAHAGAGGLTRAGLDARASRGDANRRPDPRRYSTSPFRSA